MAPEQEPKFETEPSSQAPQAQPARRRGRRAGRGRRGHGSRAHHQPRQSVSEEPELAPSEAATEESTIHPTETEVQPEKEDTLQSVAKGANVSAVQGAIEEVNHIIELLRESLDEMEEVLETLELAERQKVADERELETLRRALRHLKQPKERS